MSGPPSNPTVKRGDADLDQAIQAADEAMHRSERPVICGDAACTCEQAAHIAVRAAAPILLHAARDRHAEVEAEIERLRIFEQAIRDALKPGRWRGFDGPDGVSKDEVIADVAIALAALDQAAQREEAGDE